jgi:ABC-2 type transport system permease protein
MSSPHPARAVVVVVGAETNTAPPGLLEQIGAVARRSITRTLRQRALLVFPLLFPLILFAINGSSLGAATRIRGFPTDNYRDFALALPFIQGALFVSISTGTDLARDIETGFFNRLALTPLQGPALLVGQLGGSLVLACIQSAVYLLVGIATGVGIASGVAGACVLLALSILIAFGFAGLGALLALRFGTGEAVQGIFPLLFVSVFLSSSSLPRNLIKVDWFRTVATYNPVSYLIEGVRSLIIKGWDGQALALGFGFAALLVVITLGLASAAMKTRLVRT